MARKRARILADAISSRLEEKNDGDQERRAYTPERESLIAEASDGRLKNGKIRLVDPSTCRMWDGHNRLYDLMTPDSVGDLIKSIKASGRQEMPAIVRPLTGEKHQYEVICGARRHFAVSHLREKEHRQDILYLVDIREISDEEAFRLSDLENREREDISDFERSRDYGRALEAYYEGNRSLMAERIGVDRTWLSRYLRIGELPQEVIRAYGDVREIGIRHAAELSSILGSDSEPALLMEAKKIAAELGGGEKLTASQTLKRLKHAAIPQPSREIESVFDPEGRVLATIERRSRSHVLTIPKARLANKDDVLKAIEKLLS
ncbi:ParB/RepB/Spo0J family partition protein [Parvularcula maris]|uniref:ParB/RepB/Spo0J family partition protein n=1 Tax=Parvularcula maris TaxID=2965077 RepID=A0A9X2L9K0_9PROT|nr:ParB/RepB/Spo0J family partition protein [Parvularcula maris]MCQ8185471.1 ParB/RepB/Spo0J family partition protein [Parvularcula maris]